MDQLRNNYQLTTCSSPEGVVYCLSGFGVTILV